MSSRSVVRNVVYAATFLMLLGHGGPGNCDDAVRNVKNVGKLGGGGNTCSQHIRPFVAIDGCYVGELLQQASECGTAQLTLPDGRTITGTYEDDVATYETDRGTCWLSAGDSLLVCWGDAGACESRLSLPAAVDAGLSNDESDGGDGGDGGG